MDLERHIHPPKAWISRIVCLLSKFNSANICGETWFYRYRPISFCLRLILFTISGHVMCFSFIRINNNKPILPLEAFSFFASAKRGVGHCWVKQWQIIQWKSTGREIWFGTMCKNPPKVCLGGPSNGIQTPDQTRWFRNNPAGGVALGAQTQNTYSYTWIT